MAPKIFSTKIYDNEFLKEMIVEAIVARHEVISALDEEVYIDEENPYLPMPITSRVMTHRFTVIPVSEAESLKFQACDQMSLVTITEYLFGESVTMRDLMKEYIHHRAGRSKFAKYMDTFMLIRLIRFSDELTVLRILSNLAECEKVAVKKRAYWKIAKKQAASLTFMFGTPHLQSRDCMRQIRHVCAIPIFAPKLLAVVDVMYHNATSGKTSCICAIDKFYELVNASFTTIEYEMVYRLAWTARYADADEKCEDSWERMHYIYEEKAKPQSIFDFTITHELPESAKNLLTAINNLINDTLAPHSIGERLIKILRSIVVRVVQWWMTKDECKNYYIALTCLELVMDHCDRYVLDALCQSYSYIRGLVTGSTARAQSADGEGITSLIGTALVGALSAGSEMPKARWFKCVKAFGELGKASDGFKSLIEFLQTVGGRFFEMVREFVTGKDATADEISQLVAKYEWFNNEFVELNDEERIKAAKQDPFIASTYRHAFQTAMSIESALMDLNLSAKHLADLKMKIARLRVHYETITSSGVYDAGSRVEPVVVYLHGEPGNGKSFVSQWIANYYLAKKGIHTDDPFKYMYKFNPTDDYMSGYTGQPVLLMDDVCQTLDLQTVPNKEIMFTIFAANVAPMPLNMAALHDKGNTYLNSPLIIMTSNTAKPNIVSITEKDAFYRRISPLHFEVRANEQYAKKVGGKVQLDKSKLQGVDLRCWDFISTEILEGSSLCEPGTVFNFTGLMGFLSEQIDQRIKMNKTIQETFKTALSLDELMRVCPPTQLAKGSHGIALTDYTTSGSSSHVPARRGNPYLQPPPVFVPINLGMPPPGFVEPAEEAKPDVGTPQMFSFLKRKVDSLLPESPLSIRNMNDVNDLYNELRNYVMDGTLSSERCEVAFPTRTDMSASFEYALRLRLVSTAKMYIESDLDRAYDLLKECQDNSLSLYARIKMTLLENAANPKRLFLLGLGAMVSAWVGYTLSKKTVQKLVEIKAKFAKWTPFQIELPQTEEEAKVLGKVIANFRDKSPAAKFMLVRLMTDSLLYALEVAKEDEEFHHYMAEFPVREEINKRLSDGNWDAQDAKTKLKLCEFVVAIVRAEIKTQAQSYAGVRVKPVKVQDLEELEDLKALLPPTAVDAMVKLEVISEIRHIMPPLTDHNHEAIPKDGKAHKHSHLCERCGNIFVHAHKRKSYEESIKYTHLCKECKVSTKDFVITREETSPQATDNVGLVQVRSSIITNMYSVFRSATNDVEKPTGVPLLQGVFVRGRAFLVPSHCNLALDQFPYVKLVGMNDTVHVFPFKECRWVRVFDDDGKQRECCILECPTCVPMHRDITSLIGSQKDHVSRCMGDAHLISMAYSSSGKNMAFVQWTSFKAFDTLDCDGLGMDGKEKWARVGYNYDIPTKDGDCGAILFESSKYRTRRLIGMHIAGGLHRNVGYSERIQQEWIMKALESVNAKAQICQADETFTNYVSEDIYFDEEGSGTYDVCDAMLGVSGLIPVGSARRVIVPSETNIVKSLFHGEILPPTQMPAMLKPTEEMDPMQKGIVKLTGNNKWIDADLLEDVARSIECEMQERTQESLCRAFDLETAAYGNYELSPYMTGVNRKTSPGYPYVFTAKGPGKTYYIGDTDNRFIRDELRQAVEDRLRRARAGQRTMTLYVDTLKDETRPIEKVQAGKTRVFAVGPVCHTLACKQMFMGFCAHVMENRIYNEMALGIDVFSQEWDELARFFKNHDRMIAGDLENFDGSLMLQILTRIGEIIIKWYDQYDQSEEDRMCRRTLFSEITTAYHNCNGKVYQSTHSQTSGNILTTVINCLFLKIVMRLAFVEMGGRLEEFKRVVQLSTFGDDNIMSVSRAAPKEFHQQGLTKILKEFGLTYTDEAKSGREFFFRNLTEVEFLKRSFYLNPDYARWVGPLREDVLYNMMDWQKKTVNPVEQMQTNYEVLMRELTYHPVDKWHIAEDYKRLAERMGVPVALRVRSRLIADLQSDLYRVIRSEQQQGNGQRSHRATIQEDLDYLALDGSLAAPTKSTPYQDC